jgi:predicted tellurium resistance membrane protein TerC
MNWSYLFDLLISLLTLSVLEIVLGIDNLVVIAVTTNRLPAAQQARARYLGLTLAWFTRLGLLASAVWLSKLTAPIFSISTFSLSMRDLFFIIGGLFLIVKTVQEFQEEYRRATASQQYPQHTASFKKVIIQIVLLDIIFSLDSVLTAVGLTQQFWIMAFAITIAILLMIMASDPLSRFINRYSAIKIIAFSFLILVGISLLAEGCHFHIPHAYLYGAAGIIVLVVVARKYYCLLYKKDC